MRMHTQAQSRIHCSCVSMTPMPVIHGSSVSLYGSKQWFSHALSPRASEDQFSQQLTSPNKLTSQNNCFVCFSTKQLVLFFFILYCFKQETLLSYRQKINWCSNLLCISVLLWQCCLIAAVLCQVENSPWPAKDRWIAAH